MKFIIDSKKALPKGIDLRFPFNDPRKAILLTAITFVDSKGKHWHCPSGIVLDGLSVPRYFWRIQSPYTGIVRNAHVPHDRYCSLKEKGLTNETQAEIDYMFYEACLTCGASKWYAFMIYSMVRSYQISKSIIKKIF